MNRIMKKLVLPLGAAAVVGTAGFAYMASNTVQTSYAGDGTGSISGYVVSDVHYNLGSNYLGLGNGQYPINSVSFTLNHPATTAYATIGDPTHNGGGRVYNHCTSTDPYHWTCAFSGGVGRNATAGGAGSLEVIASN